MMDFLLLLMLLFFRIEPFLPQLRQLHRKNGKQVDKQILSEIFGDPLVRAKIHSAVTEAMPAHIRSLEEMYNNRMRHLNEHQWQPQNGPSGYLWLFLLQTLVLTRGEMEWIRNDIRKSESKLRALHDVNEMIDKSYKLVLATLFSLGGQLIRDLNGCSIHPSRVERRRKSDEEEQSMPPDKSEDDWQSTKNSTIVFSNKNRKFQRNNIEFAVRMTSLTHLLSCSFSFLLNSNNENILLL